MANYIAFRDAVLLEPFTTREQMVANLIPGTFHQREDSFTRKSHVILRHYFIDEAQADKFSKDFQCLDFKGQPIT